MVRESDIWAGTNLAADADGHIQRPADDTSSARTELIAYDPATDTFERSSDVPGSFDTVIGGGESLVLFVSHNDDCSHRIRTGHRYVVAAACDPDRATSRFHHAAVGADDEIYVPGLYPDVPEALALFTDRRLVELRRTATGRILRGRRPSVGMRTGVSTLSGPTTPGRSPPTADATQGADARYPEPMKVALLAGGTGGTKLAHGFALVSDRVELTVIANVGDDVELHGLHISPDIDALLYTLGGLIDAERGWGVRPATPSRPTPCSRATERRPGSPSAMPTWRRTWNAHDASATENA